MAGGFSPWPVGSVAVVPVVEQCIVVGNFLRADAEEKDGEVPG